MTGAGRVILRSATILLLVVSLTACTTNRDGSPNPTPTTTTERGTPGAQLPRASLDCLPQAEDRGYTWDQLIEARICTADLYQWPPGRKPDQRAVAGDPPPEFREGRFERGLEYTANASLNECAWIMTWLDAYRAGDTATAGSALAYMNDVLPNLHTLIPGNPDTTQPSGPVPFLVDLAAKAALGDPSIAQQYVDGNCQGMVWLESS